MSVVANEWCYEILAIPATTAMNGAVVSSWMIHFVTATIVGTVTPMKITDERSVVTIVVDLDYDSCYHSPALVISRTL